MCRINSTIQLDVHTAQLEPSNARTLLADYDIVLDCTDNAPTRYLLSDTAVALGVPLVFQLLVVPVTDNTAYVGDARYPSWEENKRTVSLVPDKMLWFRKNYSPDSADWTKWDNSPIFAPDDYFKKSPPAWIAVAELDILRDEGIAYGEKLKKAGVPAEVKVYKGAPHPIMAMDGRCFPGLSELY